MLQLLSGFTGYKIHATDGVLGKVDEYYFDDESWTIRYFVARTGSWLDNRKVLLSVVALGTPEWRTQTIPVRLTRDQVRNSPDITTELPIHRHHEIDIHNYYQWPFYWDGAFPGAFGVRSFPGEMIMPEEDTDYEDERENTHVQSTRFLTGNPLHTTDGEIGHLEDFIVETDSWTLNDIVVTTGMWHLGKMVLVPVQLVQSIDNNTEMLHLTCTKEDVRDHHEFDPLKSVEPQEDRWVTA